MSLQNVFFFDREIYRFRLTAFANMADGISVCPYASLLYSSDRHETLGSY